MFDLQASDILTIGLLVLLEGVLSADNALVLAILVLTLPKPDQQRALRYGMLGAFGFRALAVLLASYLMRLAWVKLVGGLYLAYLAAHHFWSRQAAAHATVAPAKGMFGLSPFWATVVRVELVDLAFSVDSILVAVALSPKLTVVVMGGILGIIAMRLVAGQMIELIRKYPTLVDGAFIIIGWVAIKLVLEYALHLGWVDWHIPKSLSLGVIVVIFAASYAYARRTHRGQVLP
jgi:YkoY family integral membrane protein